MIKIVWVLAIICIINNVRNGNSAHRAQDRQSILVQKNWSTTSTTELTKTASVIAVRSFNVTTELPKELDEQADKWVGYSRQLKTQKKKHDVKVQNSQVLPKPQNVVTVVTPSVLRRQTADMPNYDDPEAQQLLKQTGVIGGSPFASDYFSSKELWDFARNLEGQGVPIHGAARQGYNRPPWRQNFGGQTPYPVHQQPNQHAKFLDAGKEEGPQYGLLEGGNTKISIMKAMFDKAKSKLAELGAKISPLNVGSQLNQLPKKDDFGKPVRWVKFNSDEIAYGIAQVTDPLTMKNQQFTIDGAIYVPVKSRPALKTGDPDPDYMALLESSTSAIAPLNETLQTIVRNVKIDKMTMMDWLITETLEVTDNPSEKSCIANKCTARCKNMNCDSVCNGALCTSGCVGVSCNAFCSGTGCLSMCIGESCSSKCTGLNCATRCWGSGCRAQCAHRNCFEYVNGVYTKQDPNEDPNRTEKPNTRGRPQEYGRPPDGYTGYGDAAGRNSFAYDYGIPMPGPPNDYGRPMGPNDYGRPNGPPDYGRASEFGGYGRPAETGYGRPGPYDYGNPGPVNYERPGPVGRQGNYGRKPQSSYQMRPWRERTKSKSMFEEPKRPGFVRPGGPDGYLGPGYANVDGMPGSYKRAAELGSNRNLWSNDRSATATPDGSEKAILKDKKEEEMERKLAAARKEPEYVDLYALSNY